MDKSLIRGFLAELIGTFLLVLFGAGAVCINFMMDDKVRWPGLIGIALTQGLLLAVLLSVTLHFSGGYLNPAVTLMFWCFNRLTTSQMVRYVVAQLLGAALAGFCLYQTFDDEVRRESHLGTPHVNLAVFHKGKEPDTLTELVALGTGIELALTFFLVFAIFGTMLVTRSQRLTGLMVGLALAVVTLVGFPITGAAANPARWFGLVLWERLDWQLDRSPFYDMFVYVGGPILGALIAGALFFKFFLPETKQDEVFPRPEVAEGPPPAVAAGDKARK
jgi:aquaporin Z